MHVLALKCHNHETYCNSVILGEEEAHFRPGIRSFPGSSVLMYGEGLQDDLHQAALKVGWQWDGTQWLCLECIMSRITKQLNAEAVKVKRAKLDKMLSECSLMQNALFNKIYGDRARHEKKELEDVLNEDIDEAIELVERTLEVNASIVRHAPNNTA